MCGSEFLARWPEARLALLVIRYGRTWSFAAVGRMVSNVGQAWNSFALLHPHVKLLARRDI